MQIVRGGRKKFSFHHSRKWRLLATASFLPQKKQTDGFSVRFEWKQAGPTATNQAKREQRDDEGTGIIVKEQ